MKTTNNLQKTENKKFRMSVSKTFAVVASLVLISFTVSANGFWKQVFVNNTFGKMATLMVDHPTEALSTPTGTEVHVSYPVSMNISAANFSNALEHEKALQVERWMVDAGNFGVTGFEGAVETDSPLALEPWMRDDASFSVPGNEPALQVEAWMTNELVWK